MNARTKQVLQWIGRGGIGLAVFFVLWVGFMIIGFCFPQWTRSVLRGKVVDASSGGPVANAKIWTWSLAGWMGSFEDSTHANQNGAFLLIRRSSMSTPSLHAHATGYAPFDLDAYSKITITIRLAKLTEDYASVHRRTLFVRVSDEGVWQSLSFGDRSLEIDSIGPPGVDVEAASGANRDFSILARDMPEPTIEIQCWGKGGIALADSSSDEYGERQFVTRECMAPEDGYVRSLTIRPGNGWRTCFLRSADGKHYARIALTVRNGGRGGRTGELMRIFLPFWYNESGGRGVCSEN